MSDTYTQTHNRDDVRRVHASFSADYKIVAEWTGLHESAFVTHTIAQIDALALERYLSEVHIQLKSSDGAIRQAVSYRVSTDASSWSSDRPGDLYWSVNQGDYLYLVVMFTQKWRDLSPEKRKEFSDKHLWDWGTTDWDGSYGLMTQNPDRRYASRAYGLQRTRYSA